MPECKHFRYRSFEINDLMMKAKKCLDKPIAGRYKDLGLKYDLPLYLADEQYFVPMCIKVSAGLIDDPTTFEAAFILDNVRVRGVGYSPISKKRFYRVTLRKGWHQNIIDPNIPSEDPNQNRHDALADWSVTDLEDFFLKVCELWNIDSGLERGLL